MKDVWELSRARRAWPSLLTLCLALVACDDATEESLDQDAGTPPRDMSAPVDATSPSDADTTPDASIPPDASHTPDLGAPDAGPDASQPDMAPTTEKIGVFVATGSVGRTIASFDDGLAWEADQSDQSGEVCTSTSKADTDHYCFEGDKVARGIAFDGTYFFTTFGWARERDRTNSVRRSANGRDWTPVLEPGGFGAIAADSGDGTVALAGPSGTDYMMVSKDGGETWTKVDNGYGTWTNFRHAAHVSARGGLFVFAADGNGFETNAHVTISRDGDMWQVPSSIPNECPTKMRLTGGIASVGPVTVMVGEDGSACQSGDSGVNWEVIDSLGAKPTSHDALTTSDGVYVWSRDHLHVKRDALSTKWESYPLSPQGVSIGAVAQNPDTGTFVAVTSGYLSGYDKQRFYRSEDGISWTELPETSYTRSHPILSIAFGRIPDPNP